MAGNDHLRSKGDEPQEEYCVVKALGQIKHGIMGIPKDILKGAVNVGEEANIL